MKRHDWNDPRLRQIGKTFAAEAYELASELHTYGADASVLLLPKEQQRIEFARRPLEVCIPAAFADALMAVLLSLPRPERGSGRRRGWSPDAVQALILGGMSNYAASRKEAELTGVPVETIERGMCVWRKNKAPKKKAQNSPISGPRRKP